MQDMLRRIIREELVTLFDPAEEEEVECEDCPAMACIRDHRDVIRDLERRIAVLENQKCTDVPEQYPDMIRMNNIEWIPKQTSTSGY